MTGDAKGPTKDTFFVVEVKGAPEVYFRVLRASNGQCLTVADSKQDADMIADAFNVYAETGLTPREIMEERGRLRKALVRCHDWILSEQIDGNREGEDIRLEAEAALSPEKKEPKS